MLLGMDVTPQLLKDVEFRQSLRGYDPDEVDLFLQRVGAGVAQLQGRLAEAISRAEAAEARIDRGDAPAKSKARSADQPTEETITRTLLIAQQTADRLLSEAREEAATTVADAQNEAQQLRSVAEQETEELRATTASEVQELRSTAEVEVADLRTSAEADAAAQRGEAEQLLATAVSSAAAERAAVLGDVESEARRVAEETREPLLAEIRELETQRTALQGDVDLLETHVVEQRNLIRSSIGRLQSVVDNPDTLRVAEAPATSEFSSATADAVHVETEPVYAGQPVVVEAGSDPIDNPIESLDDDVDHEVAIEPAANALDGAEAEATETEEVEVAEDAAEVGADSAVAVFDQQDLDEAIELDDQVPAGTATAAVAGTSILDEFGATTTEVADADRQIGDDLGFIEPSDGSTEVDIDLSEDGLAEVNAEDDSVLEETEEAPADFDALDASDDLASDAGADEQTETDLADQSEPAIDISNEPADESVEAAEVDLDSAIDSEVDEEVVLEDDVAPAFDNDDFFAESASDEVEVIDLTSEDTAEIAEDVEFGSAGEPTQAFSTIGAGGVAQGDEPATGDAFLDELRRAVGEEETDDDPAMVAFFDDDSEGPTRRFGRGS